MALTSTIYNFDLEISDVDRNVYAARSVAVACHPSESPTFLVTRVLAYCLEYTENLEFTRGLSESDEPALWARDLTGALQAWIEVGSPSTERLHRARKACPRVAIYATRDPRQLVEHYRQSTIYKRETIELFFPTADFLNQLHTNITRRNTLSLSRSDGILYARLGDREFDAPLRCYILDEDR